MDVDLLRDIEKVVRVAEFDLRRSDGSLVFYGVVRIDHSRSLAGNRGQDRVVIDILHRCRA